jgi:hypothetical protein
MRFVDVQLRQRWIQRAPPFDGSALVSRPMNVVGLARFVGGLLRDFRDIAPDLELAWVEDWHDVDGALTESEAASWDDVFEVTATEEALIEVCPEADRAWFGIFAVSGEFYLRFRLDTHYRPALGLLAISGHGTLLQRTHELALVAGVRLDRMLASEYYDARWAG